MVDDKMTKLNPYQSLYLDALRGMSALAVLLGHILSSNPQTHSYIAFFPIQSYGVIIFFALSGFLIGYSCIVKKEYSYWEFLVDRFSRIFCVYVPSLIFVSIIDNLFLNHVTLQLDESFSTFVLNILMLNQVCYYKLYSILPRISAFGSAAQLWTLAIEWWLYVGFGGVFFFSLRSSLRTNILTSILLFFSFATLYFVSKGLVFIWFISVFIAVIFNYRVKFPVSSVQKISSVLMVMSFISKFFMKLKVIFVFFSNISYSLYLTHYSIWRVYETKYGIDGYADVLALSLICIVVSYVFTLLIDSKYRVFRDFLRDKIVYLTNYRIKEMSV